MDIFLQDFYATVSSIVINTSISFFHPTEQNGIEEMLLDRLPWKDPPFYASCIDPYSTSSYI